MALSREELDEIIYDAQNEARGCGCCAANEEVVTMAREEAVDKIMLIIASSQPL